MRKPVVRNLATVLGLLTIAVLVVAPFYPGLNSYDANETIYEGQHGYATDWLTGAGSLFLRVWFEIGLTLETAWIVQVLLAVGGAFLLLRFRLPNTAALLWTALIILWPTTYGQLASVSRDTAFIGLTLVTLWFLALAVGTRANEVRRKQLLGAAFALAIISVLVRQNGAATVAAVAVAGVLMLWPGMRRNVRVVSLAAVVLGSMLFSVGLARAVNVAFGVKSVHPERAVFIYDIASIDDLGGGNHFPAFLQKQRRVAWVTPPVGQRWIDQKFDWPNVISLYSGITWGRSDPVAAKHETPVLRRAWLNAVSENPQRYLWSRTRLTLSELGIVKHQSDAYLGVVAPGNFGRPPEFTHGLDTSEDYLHVFVGPRARIPTEILWPYFLIGGLALFLLWRWRPSDRPLFAAIATFAVANLLIIAAVAPAAGYRYFNTAVPLAFVVVAWAISAWRSRPADRSISVAGSNEAG